MRPMIRTSKVHWSYDYRRIRTLREGYKGGKPQIGARRAKQGCSWAFVTTRIDREGQLPMMTLLDEHRSQCLVPEGSSFALKSETGGRKDLIEAFLPVIRRPKSGFL